MASSVQTAAMRVLVVDDDPHLRPIMRRLLQRLGYTDVVEASDGRQALDTLANGPVDLILTDWDMPGMDGLGLIKELRTRGICTPIIMVSGRTDQQSISEALAAGAMWFMSKPVDPDRLAQAIGRLLSRAAA